MTWFTWLILAVFLAIIGYLVYTKQWTWLRELAYALMLQAVRSMANYEGRKKFEAVFCALYYNLIPAWMRWYITPDRMREELQKRYTLAKDYLDNGVMDKSAVK